MKKLTKIKLINWHSYINNTIDINNNAIICGENGSGKSTLLDAINYVISCGTCKFNTAANERNDRNVESYVRGKLSFENKKFLRDGDVISHIALEFFDEFTNKFYVVGSVISYTAGSKLDKRFYFINEAQIIEDNFIKKEKNKVIPVSFGELKDNYIANNDKIIEEFSKTQDLNKIDLLYALGLEKNESKKYLELLPKALAFKPISDVNKFVYDYLLPEKELALDNMKNSVRTLSDIKSTILLEESKLNGLEEIENLSYGYENKKILNDEMNSILLDREYSKIKEEKIKYTKELETTNKEINTLNARRIEIGNQKDELFNDINNLKNLEEDKVLISLREKSDKLKSELETYNKKDKENKDRIEELSVYLNSINLMNSLKMYYYKEDFNKVNDEIFDIKYKIEEKYNNCIEDKNRLNSDYEIVNSKVNQLKKNINELEKGLKPYPEYTKNLKEILEEYFKDKYDKDIKVSVFSDLVKNVDKEWKNALEGFLNTRRFYLFVDEIYYDEALRVYNEIAKTGNLNVYTAGLVATNTLKEINEEEINENSLFTKMEYDSEYVRRYSFMILNNVICVDSVDDLKKHDISITKDGMLYQAHVARFINPNIYKTPYLGRDSILVQLEDCNNALKKNEEIQSNLYDSIIINTNEINFIKKSNTLIRDIDLKENLFEKIKKLTNEVALNNDEINKLNNSNFIKNQELIKEKENLLSSLKEEEEDVILNLRLVSGKKMKYEDRLTEIDNKLDSEEYIKNINSNVFNKLKEQYKDQSNEDIENNINKNKIELDKSKKEIESYMKNYCVNIDKKCELNPTIDNLNKFINIYNDIKNREIIKYKEKANRAQEEADIAFKNDYLTKIRSFIEEEKENIKVLNNILKDPNNKFGQELETYEFVIEGTEDAKLKPYYELLMSNEDFNSIGLLSSPISQKNRELMDDLFKRITSDDEKENEKELVKFLDYRNFMRYDIKIIDRNNNVSYYSKGGKGKSGGETQTPFYVFIAASFNQICTKTKFNKMNTPICLMFLDEAFNNMDESRIESMMNFYSKLNIQLLISVPTQRAPSMLNHVQTALGVIKDKNITTVFDMKKVC